LLAKVRVWSLQLVSFLVGLKTYEHTGMSLSWLRLTYSSYCHSNWRL